MKYIYKKSDMINILKSNPVIIMDTNVWLDLYSLSPETISDVVEAIDRSNLIWIPHQVFIEFHRRVKDVRERNLKRYDLLKEEVCDVISKANNQITSLFNTYNKHKLMDIITLQKEIEDFLREASKKAKNSLMDTQVNHEKEMKANSISMDGDFIEDYLLAIKEDYSESNGFSVMQLLEIYEEGEKRYKYKIPPGFTDLKKGTDSSSEIPERKYGDLIIWKEILDYVGKRPVNVIFVNNERKSDWWVPENIKKNRIPTVLEQEFQSATKNQASLYMVPFYELVHHLGEELYISKNSILEITEKIAFISDVNKYFKENLNTIIQNYKDSLSDKMTTELSINALGEYVAGGNIDEIDDIEITGIKTLNEHFEFDTSDFEVNVAFQAEVTANANVVVYWGKENNTSGLVEIKALCEFGLVYTIDYTKEVMNSYSIYDEDVTSIKITKIIFDEYQLDGENFDEGEYTCPDCGRAYSGEDDGGNGFCVNCAWNH
ncbi:PIN-like domain-containing protein [Paenibacillus cellulositrophicus]|uniref:PIN-like domain-containing protein n=1 Tax=Paenibacillus cellulositrophicus TaxID=562959 RepID=UPI00203AA850|nr:PIN-like domain-containing protein [Paenibacillus cellulositrophicus]MCM2999967.1 PIN-like domain-containing protein [Paenibacillus cellulositrophicus]